MAISAREFLERRKTGVKAASRSATCVTCNVQIQETITGSRCTSKGIKCSDSYFVELSDLLEEAPIGSCEASSETGA